MMYGLRKSNKAVLEAAEKRTGKKCVATHRTQDYGFAGRKHTKDFADWNTGIVVNLGWTDHHDMVFALLK